MISVADVMTRRPVMMGADATITEALNAMKARGISSVLVPPLPGSSEYGIVTMRDIVSKVVKEDLDPDSVHLGDIMTWRLVTARPSWTLQEAAALMAKVRVRRLPVDEGAEIIGLVSDTDLFTALVPRHEWEHVRLVRKERALQRASRTGPAKMVTDLMSAPVLTVARSAAVPDAVRKMVASGISSLLVTSAEEGAEGIMTKRDVITKVMAHARDPGEVTVGEVASAPVRTIAPDVTVEECSAKMASEGVRRFPVARQGQIVGIISDSDILAAVEAHRWRGHRRWPTTYIVADVMRTPTVDLEPVWEVALSPELSLWEAATKLVQAGVGQLPVVQDGKVIGVVSHADIVRALEERGGGD
jgi:signal-transduction protein with cAMP-binding, CBS, and nucleotidyltransferase domain